MIRTLIIYIAVLTFAEFSFGRISHADDASTMKGEVVFADMKPVMADGKDIPPKITDFKKASKTVKVSKN